MGSISRIVSMSKKIIKPSSATPPSHKRHNLSLLDCYANNEYASSVMFYPKPTIPSNNISQLLQKSLSKALTYYYPFAGMLKDNTYVDCNDRGAEFLNVRVDGRMSDVINSCDNDRSGKNCVFPQGLCFGKSSDSFDGRLAMTQLTHFDCGGIAVSFCFSHKIVDGYSAGKFMSDWAAIAKDPNHAITYPQFDGASFFPPRIHDAGTSEVNSLPEEGLVQQRFVTRRYLFSASKLNTLKEKIVDSGSGIVGNPSRIESVSALLYKSASANRNNTSFRPSTFTLFANMRPPLPLNTIGNAPGYISTSIEEEVDMQLPRIVAELRKGKEKLRNRFNTVDPSKLVFESFELMKEVGQVYNREGFDIYRCSSLCNFPFYGIDFGWGTPQRVAFLIPPCNFFVLLDNQNRDGGVEALVTLEESEMTVFQQDQQILQFARPI